MDTKMNTDRAERLWAAVEERTKSLRGGKRLTEQLRRQWTEKEFAGAVVATLEDGASFERAVDILVADVEKMAKDEAAKVAKDKLSVAVAAFHLACREEADFAPDANLNFDPAAAAIRADGAGLSYGGRSIVKTLDTLSEYVGQALESPETAGTMALDHRLPWWLQRLAENLKVESADDLRPKFRGLVERWVYDPEEARRWAEFADGKLPRWAVETARVLGARQPDSG